MTIDARVELFYDSQWNPITDDVDMRSAITIRGGQPDEHSEPVPTSVALALDNTSRAYSPKDPMSALYGKIGLNTRMRTRIGDPQPALWLPGISGSYASAPDEASLDIVGDLDLRIELSPRTWRPTTTAVVAAKWLFTGSHIAWGLHLLPAGTLELSWSDDGALTGRELAVATTAVPEGSGRLAVRVTLDVDDGGQHTVTFYTAESISGSWSQLGGAVTTAGTTSIDAGNAGLTIGAVGGGGPSFSNTALYTGRVHALELRSGIGGTVVADPDFTAEDVEVTGFTDDAGLTWTIHGSSYVADPSLRASVAVSSWTPAWDETTQDARTAVKGSGILQRLGTDDAVSSTLRRGLLSIADQLVAYWPAEDGEGSTSIASALPGVAPMHIAVGAPDFEANTDFVASDPLPTPGASYWVGKVPTHTVASGERAQVRFPLSVPEAGISEQSLVAIRTSGSIATWLVVISATGGMSLRAFNRSGTSVFDSGFFAYAMNGNPKWVSVEYEQVGSNVECNLVTVAPGGSGSQLPFSSISNHTVGITTEFQMGSIGDCGVGHISVHNVWSSLFDLGDELAAWAGETAGERIERLCAEEGVPFTAIGDLTATAAMGAQESGTLLNLATEAVQADLGVLGESRDRPGLRYLTRGHRYNQVPVLELDMDDGHVVNPFEPPLDDQGVRNDVTVTRRDGSRARAVQTTGPRNVNSPDDDPQGVGRHRSNDTFNLHADDQLADQARFRLHLGTVDEHRIAVLDIEMEHHPDLQQTVLELAEGDLIRLSNPPAGLPPGPLDLIVLGWSDQITTQTWRVSLTLAPASPWSVIQLDDGVSKLGSRDSTLHAGIDTDDTSLSVGVSVHEDFEDATFITTITGTWTLTTDEFHGGAQSARSADIGDDETSSMVWEVPETARTVQFWYKVSSEADFDFFQFLIDDAVALSVAGDVDWTQSAEYTVGYATTVTFRYVKDGALSVGDDAAYLDDVTFRTGVLWTTAAGQMPIPITIGGEAMSVTAIAGTSSPQTFTVTRSSNGIVKSHATGAEVRLTRRATLAL